VSTTLRHTQHLSSRTSNFLRWVDFGYIKYEIDWTRVGLQSFMFMTMMCAFKWEASTSVMIDENEEN
jgi:hypothetical protein